MQRLISSLIIVLWTFSCIAANNANTNTSVSGKVHIGAAIDAANTSEVIDLTYQTNDHRLGDNSGNHYSSIWNQENFDTKWLYGASIKIKMHPQHQLGFVLEGKHDCKSISSTRNETICDPSGVCISQAKGPINHPQDKISDILAGFNYAYALSRGDSLQIGYRYHLDYTSIGFEQQVNERTDWALYSTNKLYQQINEQTHRAYVDYICRIARGHMLDLGIAYDRRQIDVHTQQDWDRQCHLNGNYRHLTQYAAASARYRLKIGPVSASAGLEYRATKMQQRWLHDFVPSAMLHYQIDSVHSLTGGYRMLIIRPDYSQMDTTVIADAYTRSFGNNQLIGVHVHNTNLTYRMILSKLSFSTEIRYITTNDGLNALWMERNNVRIYTWGNEGIRHAVGLTPSIDSRLGKSTRLKWTATILWDERIAKAISMSNDNWGFSTKLRLEQRLPYAMFVVLHGDYAYHNTLDLYSYAGHGGQLGMDWKIAMLQHQNLTFQLGYTCRFTADIHITQGAYTGVWSYPSRCTHLAQLQIEYKF